MRKCLNMKLDILNRLYQEAIVAILRADTGDGLLQVADAIKAGGLSIIEVTMTTPNALDVIRQASEQLGDDVYFGAGSVLDAETARLAILAGARFIVTPTMKVEVIRVCNRYSVPVVIGCYTPTEVQTAWEQGADLVKLFPASQGGLAHMKALKAPLPQVEFVPTGGINLDNASDYLRAGAFAIGIGSALVSHALLEANDFPEITRRAHAYRQIGKELRG